jgi:excinuclease ABC subunit A
MVSLSKKQLPVQMVEVRGARQNNLRNLDLDIPRDAFVCFTGVSGSGKSSIAFGTIYAEAQRRYFESIAPYARRLIDQLPAPHVSEIRGLPPAVALQQRRGEPTARSSVGTLTTLSNSLRMLFSRAGTYPAGSTQTLDSNAFSPNTPEGACPACHGIGVVHSVSEESLVPDPTLSIRDGAIAAWPGAWQGKNYRDILDVLGYNVDKPFHELSEKDRKWILFTDEKPVVTVHAIREAHRIQRPYQGTYMSAAAYVKHTFATTQSAVLRKRVLRFMDTADCADCHGKRLKAESLAVRFAGNDIASLTQMPLAELKSVLASSKELKNYSASAASRDSKLEAAWLIAGDLIERINLLSELGLDYLSMDRSIPTLSAGELQRLRLTTQLRSGLFGVVYVLDEPSAGLHPADAEALYKMLKRLQDNGNSLFVVEHDMEMVKQADWIVDIGPGAGDSGGNLIYSGPVAGLAEAKDSVTRGYLFPDEQVQSKLLARAIKKASGTMTLRSATRHNLKNLAVDFPLGVLTVVTGVSGSGKSTLVSQLLAETLKEKLGSKEVSAEEETEEEEEELEEEPTSTAILEGCDGITRLVCVDQKPIGRTPRSNLATYTGLFDHVRKRFAATPEAKSKHFNAGRFSFNVAGGRCTTCEGEGFVSIELMFLPSVYAPCSSCRGTRYNPETLEVTYKGMNIAQVLDMTVDSAIDFFAEIPAAKRALKALCDVGLGYLHLGQPATELSGGEAQRIKLATELQREQHGSTVYLLDEPTTGLHPSDVEKLMAQLNALVDAGNTVIVVEHDMDVVAAADWVMELGPGAGSDGGSLVGAGTPREIAGNPESRTSVYLARKLGLKVQ